MENGQTMHNAHYVSIAGESFWLSGDRTVYWAENQTLIVSDLHIGKVMHFRKAGYAVPLDTLMKNFETLSFSLLNNKIEKVIFLGDLYHSTENTETQLFWDMIEKFPNISFVLIKGNHDVHDDKHFEKKGLTVFDELSMGPFLFTHEPKTEKGPLYNIAGHIHPAVKLRGKARSYLRLPCFYFKEWQAILPAFGAFTGLYSLSPKKGEKVFAIVNDDKIIDVSIR